MKDSNPKKDEKSEAEKLAAIIRDDTERYIGALSENFQHGLSAVAEQFLGLNEKVDALAEKVDSLAEFTTKRFIDVGARFDTLESRFDTLESKVDDLQSDVSVMRQDLKQKVDHSKFFPLEERVAVLEA